MMLSDHNRAEQRCNMPSRPRILLLVIGSCFVMGTAEAQETVDRTGRFVGIYFDVERTANSVCQDAQVLIKRAGDRIVFEQMERDFMRERKGKGDSRANAIFLEPDKPALVFEYPMYSHGFNCARIGVEVLTGRPLDELKEEATRIKSEAIRKFPEASRPTDGGLVIHWENSGAIVKTFSYDGPLEIKQTHIDPTLTLLRVTSRHQDGLLPVLIEREQVNIANGQDVSGSQMTLVDPVVEKYLLSPGGQLTVRIVHAKNERITIKHAEQAVPMVDDTTMIDKLRSWIRAFMYDPTAPVKPSKVAGTGVRG